MNKAAILLVTTMFFASNAVAEDSATAEAEELLRLMDTENLLQESINYMLDVQLQQNPGLLPYRGVMITFFQKHMSYQSLKPELLRIYSSAFTASELRDLAAFYKTPTGMKSLRVMPELTAEGAQIGAQRIQENMQELQAMIAEEANRIQAMQSE